MSKITRSRVAPTTFARKDGYLIIGDNFVRNLLVTGFPEVFNFGLLSYYISNPRIKVFIKSSKLQYDMSAALSKEYKAKKREYDETSDPQLRQRIDKKLMGLDRHISDIVNNNDCMLDVLMIFSITCDNLDDLNNETKSIRTKFRNMDLKVTTLASQQEKLLKATSPLFLESRLDPTLEYNYGIPLTATSFAGMWPYNFQYLKDEKGFLFGFDMNNNGVIKWDPMYFVNNRAEAVKCGRTASNIAVFGKTGSGKTTAMMKIITNLIYEKTPFVWMDPENKNYYLTKQYGGTFINWGVKGNQINMFDLLPVSSDEDENVNIWDTEIAIYNAIDMFKSILRLYQYQIGAELFSVLNLVDDLIIRMYQKKGITFKTEFKGLPAEAYPILSDLMYEVDKEITESMGKKRDQLEELKSYINPMIKSHKYFFDGHTTIKQEDSVKFISFGMKSLKEKDRSLKDSLNFIMFRYAWALCIRNNNDTGFIVDEGHEMILEGLAAKELSSIWRRSRKYHNTAVFGSQDPSDLSSEVMIDGVKMSVYGKSMMNNSTYKIFMMMEKEAVESLDKLVAINVTEKTSLQQFEQGQALFLCGKQRFAMNIIASKKELREMDPIENA